MLRCCRPFSALVVTLLLVAPIQAQASEGEGEYHTFSGFGGYGVTGVGGETPPHDYYIQLDVPYTVDDHEWQMLLTDYVMPQDSHVTLCGRVEVRQFDGIESHYPYALLTDVQGFEACQ